MPQNVVSSSIFTDPIRSPADGDVINAASVLNPVQALANRTLFTNNDVVQINSGTVASPWRSTGNVHFSGSYSASLDSRFMMLYSDRCTLLDDHFVVNSGSTADPGGGILNNPSRS